MFSHSAVIKSDVGRRRHSSCNNVLEVQRGVLTDRSGSDSSRWRWGRGRGGALDSTRVTWMWTEGGVVSRIAVSFQPLVVVMLT